MAPTIWPATSPPTPNQSWWRRPAASTHPGCGGSWAISSWWPIPTTSTAGPRSGMVAGAVAGLDLGGEVAVEGWLEPQAGPTLRPPWRRWPAPVLARMRAAAASVAPMPWPSWPAATWRQGGCPDRRDPPPAAGDGGSGQPAGPARPGRGELGGRPAGSRGLPAAGRRRHRDPSADHPQSNRSHQPQQPHRRREVGHLDPRHGRGPGGTASSGDGAAGPVLAGAPSQPLDLGRASRVVHPAQRAALAIGDGGCGCPGCDRPRPGAKPTICGIGWTAAPPTWPTWPGVPGPPPGRP
jgi:hypothetical protein